MARIAIIYYSAYGHVEQLAETIKEGVERVPGVVATLYQCEETLSDQVLAKMNASPKKDHPIATPRVIEQADGVLFGLSVRFGMVAAQMKALWDRCGKLYEERAMIGKPAGFFFSSGSPGAGQEIVAFTSVAFLAISGMIYVPMGFPLNSHTHDLGYVHGGSEWGSGTIAASDAHRQPLKTELEDALYQGENFAEVVKKLSG